MHRVLPTRCPQREHSLQTAFTPPSCSLGALAWAVPNLPFLDLLKILFTSIHIMCGRARLRISLEKSGYGSSQLSPVFLSCSLIGTQFGIPHTPSQSLSYCQYFTAGTEHLFAERPRGPRPPLRSGTEKEGSKRSRPRASDRGDRQCWRTSSKSCHCSPRFLQRK